MIRRERHELWMRRALSVASTPPVSPVSPAGMSVGSLPDVTVASLPDAAVDSPADTAVGSLADTAVGSLANTAVGSLADVPVGAIILGPDGTELAAGRNERERTGDPTAHAEVLALRRAAAIRGEWRLDGCTLVVTLEPCTMCAGALVLARISTVIFGAWEPKTGAVGSLWDVVRDPRLNHRPEVYAGVLEQECAQLMRDFFR
ncbi:hypothetical protein Areg01_30910 [Actinoplanes regularis]|nr:hypothetical protein Areg01_30910 [Actinoplanes regularis]